MIEECEPLTSVAKYSRDRSKCLAKIVRNGETVASTASVGLGVSAMPVWPLRDWCNLCVKNPDEQRFLIANRHDGASAHIGFCGDGADGRVLVSVRDKVLFCSGKDGVFCGQALFLSCSHE